jgi:hypothetical protein
MSDGEVLRFALAGTKASGAGMLRFRVVPLVHNEDRVPDFSAGLVQFDYEAPALRLTFAPAAYSAQEVHNRSLLSANFK